MRSVFLHMQKGLSIAETAMVLSVPDQLVKSFISLEEFEINKIKEHSEKERMLSNANKYDL